MTEPRVTRIPHSLATIWLAREARDDASYFYGGTRLLSSSADDADAVDALVRLMRDESSIKNRLINRAIGERVLDDLNTELPDGFLRSSVRAARCVIRPRSAEVAASLANPLDANNSVVTDEILQAIGHALNELEPEIKLTPDFGRYAGLADVLHRYTPNVLGVACDKGGCGGKSSYSVTGVLAGARQASPDRPSRRQLTCIGAAGAMGSQIVRHMLSHDVGEAEDVGVCDLEFDKPHGELVPPGCTHLASRPGAFTAACLSRGSVIVTTALGDELARSPWQIIPKGTTLLLAQNLALPQGDSGIRLARLLARNGVLVIPGQVLTLGGALTARLEWYWRQRPDRPAFDKALAHRVVDRVVSWLTTTILDTARATASTPYEAMLRLAAEDS